MTAVMQPVDAFRNERFGAHNDDEYDISQHPPASPPIMLTPPPSSSFTDWKAKYNEVADMLQETRQELDDFQVSSRELEEELEKELARTEKAQQDLKVKAARAEHERDEWKVRHVCLRPRRSRGTDALQVQIYDTTNHA